MPPQEDGDRGRSSVDLERIRRVLERAVGRACPPHLRESIEDMVQDALVRTMDVLGKQPEGGIRTSSYLWRVAFTTMVDELRRSRRRPERVTGRDAAETAAAVADPASLETSYETRVEIRDCLGRLAEPRKLVVALYLDGFTAEESSRLLGFGIRKVRNLTFRGLKDLRRCLERKGIRP